MSLTCPLCNLAFEGNDLSRHLKFKHAGNCSLLPCNIAKCGKKFHKISVFIRHLKSHDAIETQSKSSTDNRKKEKLNLDNPDKNQGSIEQIILCENTNVDESYLENKKKVIQKIVPKKFIVDEVDYLKEVSENCDILVASLYANKFLVRNSVQPMINSFKNFYNKNFAQRIRDINKVNGDIKDFTHMANIMENAFQIHSSEKNSLKQFKSLYYVEPITVHVGTVLSSKRVRKQRRFTQMRVTVEAMPMDKMLKHFFELPNVFNFVKNHIEKMEKCEQICSVIQSKTWQEIRSRHMGKVVIPLSLFGDEFVINNVLGSRKKRGKIHAFYYSISSLPLEYSGRLENIFVAQIMKSAAKDMLSTSKLYKPLVQQIIHLQKNSLDINVDGETHKLYFDIFNFSADNLEIHGLLGLHECFNSNFPCSACLMPKSDCQKNTSFPDDLLRNKESHKLHVIEKSHGVKDSCIFSEIPDFDIFENVAFDYLHDFLEGSLRIEMAQYLRILIIVDEVFTYRLFIERLHNFNYSIIGTENVCINITIEAIKKGKIILSGSEMKFLVSNLCFIVGDLVPNENEAWKAYLSARKLLMRIIAPSIDTKTVESITSHISEHLQLYYKVTKKKFIRKQHHLGHYPRMIINLGLPRQLACNRFEGKHKALKDASKLVTSRVNAPKSMAIKHQLQVNYRFLLRKGLDDKLDFGPMIVQNVNLLEEYKCFKANLSEFLARNHKPITWIRWNGISYHPNLILIKKIESQNVIEFAVIKFILFEPNISDIIFVTLKLQTESYNSHLCGYNVKKIDEWWVVKHSQLINKLSFNCHTVGGEKYVSCDV